MAETLKSQATSGPVRGSPRGRIFVDWNNGRNCNETTKLTGKLAAAVNADNATGLYMAEY